MIVRLSGTLLDLLEESIIVERDGIAREVLVPRYSLGELATRRGATITLHTMEFLEGSHGSGHLVPRMLGFLHVEDRLFFNRFVSVKGIGPRKALKALSKPVGQIASWIEAGDAGAIAGLTGIGSRAAQLIVAALKGKVGDLALPDERPTQTEGRVLTQAQRDAIEILVAWGDTRNDAERWLDRAARTHPDLESPDEWVRVAYRVKGGVET